MRLQFEVVGKPVSNNRVVRRFGNRSVKNPQAVTYQQRIFQHAFVAVQQQGWKTPEACAVTIDAHNVRLDVDNLAKSVLDGMNAAVYGDDRCVIELLTRKLRDDGEERLVITVEHREPLSKPKRKRAA